MDKIRIRNEKVGEYLLNLSNTTMGASVLGAIVPSVYTENIEWWRVVLIVTIGLIATIILARIGENILKK